MPRCPQGYEEKTRPGTITSGTSIWKYDVTYCKKIPPPQVEEPVAAPAPVEQKVEPAPVVPAQVAPVEQKTEVAPAVQQAPMSMDTLKAQLKELSGKIYPVSYATGKALGTAEKPKWQDVSGEPCVKVDFAGRTDLKAWEAKIAELNSKGFVATITPKQGVPTNEKVKAEKPTYDYKEMKVCIPK